MKSHYMLYINNIVNNVVDKILSKGTKMVFIKHYNTVNVEEDNIREALYFDDNRIEILYYNYDPGILHDAFEPWLDWIRRLYNKYFSDMTVEEFIDNCDVYYGVKDLFIDFIKAGSCKRHEELVLAEVTYEKGRLVHSLGNIIEYISEKKALFVILNKIHFAGYSSIEVLNGIVNRGISGSFGMMCTYNDVYTLPAYVQGKWKNLIDTVEGKNMVVDWSTTDKQTLEGGNEVFTPDANDIEEYIRCINNLVHVLATEQALHYLDIITAKFNYENKRISTQQIYKLYFLYAYACLCGHEYNIAMHWSDKISALDIVKQNDTCRFEYLYYKGVLLCALERFNFASECVTECRNIAKRLDDDYYEFRTQLLEYSVTYTNWKQEFYIIINDGIDSGFIEKLDEYNYLNHKAYVYICACDDNDEFSRALLEKGLLSANVQKGIDIANDIHNNFLVVESYKRVITSCSAFGQYQLVEEYYNKCLKLLRSDNNYIEEANIYNGLGYYNIISQRFKKANDIFNMSIKLFYELRMSESIAETLYNMSMNAFMAEEYEEACNYMLTSIRIMDLLGISKLQMCNMSKMYGIIAICYYFMHVEYNCYLYMNYMERILGHLLLTTDESKYRLWDDDLFLYYLLKGLLKKNEGKFTEALANMERARTHMENSGGFKFFGFSIFSIEISKIYTKLGFDERSKCAIEECISYFVEKQCTNKVDSLYAVMLGMNAIKKNIDLKLNVIEVDDIIEQARSIGKDRQIAEKEKDMSFLVMWQELLKREYQNEEEIIYKSMFSIQSYYGVDKVLHIEVTENGPIVRHPDNKVSENPKAIFQVVECMEKLGKGFAANRIGRSFDEYRQIVSIFGINEVVSIIGTTVNNENTHIFIAYVTMNENFSAVHTLFTESSLTLFNLAFKQLIEVVERFRGVIQMNKIKKELEQALVIDSIEKERNRIAQEVHDTTGHTLTLIQSLINLAQITYAKNKNEEIVGYLQQARELTSNGISELRCSINNLKESTAHIMLTQGIYNLVNSIQGLDIDVCVQGEDDIEYAYLSKVVYETLRESITNCLRYADAEKMDVIIKLNEDSVELYIFDDGKGCDEINEGNGLGGIKARINKAGGTVKFVSSKDEGFRTIVKFPHVRKNSSDK